MEPNVAVPRPALDLVIPVYNEERDLPRCVETLRDHLVRTRGGDWRITIADNASTDATLPIARRLAAADSRVRVVHLDEKGRGRALRTAWLASDADVLAYMDVDLSTDLAALAPLVAPLTCGEADLAIGSRLCPGTRVTRSFKRETLSRGYNLLLWLAFRRRFSDAQCGFKAITREAAHALLPRVEDNEWFFDTELLLLAEEDGRRIVEVPVTWIEDPDSRVHIGATVRQDLTGIARVRRQRRERAARALHTYPAGSTTI
jgi:glycosyltransferase involved in cell wall biosynthesis